MEELLVWLHLHALSIALAFIVVGSVLVLKAAWGAPTRASLLLQQQGVSVLPYRLPLLGNALEIVRLLKSAELSCLAPNNHSYLHRVFPFHIKYFPSHGKSFVYWWGTQPTMIVTNADDVKDLMSTHSKHYHKSPLMPVLVDRMFGQGIISAEGEAWENQRRVLNPAFFVDKIKGMVRDMLASALEMADGWENLLDQASRHGDGLQFVEVEVAEAFKTLTADILARTCFGTSYKQGKAAFEDQIALLKLTWEDTLWHLLIPGYRYFPTHKNIQSWKLQKSILENLKEIVESRVSSVKEGLSKSYGEDLLGLILAANDLNSPTNADERKPNNVARLSISQIIDDCKTFFFAGHETTASLLGWTIMLLSEHKDWQDKARLEVLEVCGDRSQMIKADHLGKLKVVSMILNESLRLYPPAPQLLARLQITKGSKMGKLWLPDVGLRLVAALAFLHRDPSLWGDDVDLFNPQRFVDGPSKACKHPNGFVPFGLGPHTCIGQNFALTEAKLILAVILQRFQFSPSPNYKHAPRTQITLAPQFGLPILLQKLIVA